MIGFDDLPKQQTARASWRDPLGTIYVYDPNQLYVVDGKRRIVEIENPLHKVKKLSEAIG